MEILIKEGITKEYLKTIDLKYEYSPVQFKPNEEPVKLIKCSTGYWVMLDFGVYLKDEKNRLIVFEEKEVKIARARYLLNFVGDVEAQKAAQIEKKIQSEVSRLQEKVDKKATEDLNKLREILVMGGKIEVEGIEKIIMGQMELQKPPSNFPFNLNNDYDERKKLAKELATDELLRSYELLKQLHERKDYSTLYQHYFQDGLPLIGSFKTNSESDMNALKKSFHSSVIMETLDGILNNEHIYNVAKVNVLKLLNN